MSNLSNGRTRTYGSLAHLSASERYRLLAPEQRRLVLEVLTDDPPPVDLEGLAADVAVREAAGDTIDGQTVKRVATTLHHNHLPALADAGVLAYNVETHRIEPDG